MSDRFTMTDLVDILRTSIGLDEGVRLDGELGTVPFTEIGYDSLALIELASQLKHRHGVHLSDEEALARLRTPREAVAFVNDQLIAKAR